MMKDIPVPVFMYHSVGIYHPDWLWKFLTLEYRIFDQQMAVLKKNGCNSITLGELYDHMENGAALPKNPFVLTFDDGYADNWIAVAPILRKYGFTGTVYVNPEFVDPSEQCRPTLEDLWAKRVSIDDIPWKGFLSWPEMKKLEKEGILDIQSHAMSHTWYFSGPKLVDFQYPGDEYIWMNWNRYPKRKYAYMSEDPELYKDYGAPIYEHEKSLAVRRYFPNEDIRRQLIEYVNINGEKNYFRKNIWREKLKYVHDKISKELAEGRYESSDEYDERISYELQTSKEILEYKLNKKVEYLCWPGGGYNDEVVKRALAIYKSVTLGSRDKKKKKNITGENPKTIKRIGIPYVTLGDNYNKIRYQGGYSLYYLIRTFQGNSFGNICRKMIKAWYMARLKYLD